MKKIGILGSNGFIGSSLVEYLKRKKYAVVEINRQQDISLNLDLKNPQGFSYGIFDEFDYLIVTAAVSSPDICEKIWEESNAVNVIGTKFVINKALEYNCAVLFLSSDAVYGKNKSNAYNEDENTNPETSYGKMKKEIEDEFRNHSLFKSVRLSYVISQNDKFMKYVNSCINKQEVVEVFHPFYRNCVTLNEVIKSIYWIIENWEKYTHSFLNVCGTELVSRVRIIDEINRTLNHRIQYHIVYPGKEFFRVRSEVVEMSSLYIGEIVKDIKEPFSIRLQSELKIKK